MIALLLFALAVAQAGAPAAARDAQQPHAAGGTIRGRITDRETGQALPRFRVSISRQPLRTENARAIATAITDANGAYELASVPPGTYLITAQPPEHVATHLAQMHGYDEPLALVSGAVRSNTSVKAGDVLDINFTLQLSFAIEGTVTTEEGDPIANAIVTAERTDRRGAASSAVTDDLGRYRVFGLAPGGHRVCAIPGAATGPDAITSRELLVRTCNPGEKASTGLEIRTAHLSGVHLALRRIPRVSVSGEVFDSYGTPLEGGEMTFIEADPPRRSLKVGRVAPGRFVIEDVEPGKYTLQASSVAPGSAAAAAAARSEVGSLDIVVDKADIERVVLRTARREAIFGVVTFDGPPPEGGVGGMRIRLARDPASVSAAGTLESRSVRANWTFEFGNVPEPVTIALDSLPSGWLVRSIHYRGRDVTGQVVELAASDDPHAIEIALTNRIVYIGGRLTSPPPKGRIVVVLAFDAAMMRSGVRAGTDALSAAGTALVDADNVFKLGPLPAGDYLVVAVDRDEWFDASLGNRASAIASVIARAERVQVLDGEQPKLTIGIVPVR